MFDYWRERRRLRREIKASARAQRLRPFDPHDEEHIRTGEGDPIAAPLCLYELIEYERLIDKAHRLGIDYKYDPKAREGYEVNEDGRLVGPGHARLRKAIRDERFNTAERYVKIFVPLITALTGLVGVIVALITVSRK
jgi:hypothetical protein